MLESTPASEQDSQNHASGTPAFKSDESGQEGSSIFGTFFIGGNEFAISVESIQEVVNEPSEFTKIPLSPDYLLGLFNLRNLIIPVVDLRSIFGLSLESSETEDRKVAIIEHGEFCFGLLVDRTGDVFSSRDIDQNAFSHRGGDIKETIVGGVFKLDNGKRLVQALDPFELLNLEKLPRVSGSVTSALSRKKSGRRKQCISFEVGDSLCAFEMTSIKEIVELDKVDNSALAHGWTLGAIDLRGSTVPIVDFRMFLGEQGKVSPDSVAGKGYKLVVMRIGENLISLLVDSINNIISYFDDDLMDFPGVGVHRREIFKGCLSDTDGNMVLLLDHTLVINDEDLGEITRGHSKLFREEVEASRATNNNSKLKRTLISFSVGGQFALDIKDVNEVIGFPDTIVRPPNMPNFVEGMVNLRGELIPIINLRSLYHLEPAEPEQSKLLIFTSENKKYGIMVDAVDSIVNLSEYNSNVLPRLSDGSSAAKISNDVTEAVMIESGDTEGQSMMILDLGMIVSRSVGSMAA